MFRSSRKSRQQNFGYSSLEEKRLLAGDVSVVENVNLYLRGDNLDNQIEVVVAGDELRINGLDGTTINGQESFVVQGASVTESGVTFEGGLRGHFGSGHDNVEVRDVVFEAKSILYGGTGNDIIDVVDSQFLDGAVIQTFDGDDSVSTSGSHFEGDFYVFTLDGRDSVSSIDTSFNGKSIVVTGEHSDTIHSENNHYMGDVNLILSHNGNDEVQLVNPVVGENQLGVFLGNHDDTIGVDLTDASVDSTIRIAGQAGTDQSSGMTMSDEAAGNTSVFSIEKGELVYESAVGGVENVNSVERVYAEPSILDSDGNFTNTYSQQYAAAVVLETTQTIKQIEWSGAYQRDLFTDSLPDLGDNFVIEIIEDDGEPDTFDEFGRIQAFDPSSITKIEVGSASRVVAGEISYGEFGVKPVYDYTANIEFTMEAGKKYWVSIYTDLKREQAMNGDLWEWGSNRSLENVSPTTLFSGGFTQNESLWSQSESEGPVYAEYVEMDLRLRS